MQGPVLFYVHRVLPPYMWIILSARWETCLNSGHSGEWDDHDQGTQMVSEHDEFLHALYRHDNHANHDFVPFSDGLSPKHISEHLWW